MVQFVESQYRFTDPIRYFKANDPIYFEVDNIPLKQLQENDLWIKDQLAKLEYTQTIVSNIYTSTITNNTNNAPGTITRDNFDELKPYVNGTDNKVKVRPGRFTARINDAARDLPKLQYMARAAFPYSSESNPLNYQDIFLTLSHPLLYSVYEKVKNAVGADSLAMNGLGERVFTRMIRDNSLISNFAIGVTDTPRYNLPNGEDGAYPNVTGRQPVFDSNAVKAVVDSWFNPDNGGNSSRVGAESEWIKNWRGVARTAIVDIPQELEIEIPRFNPDDFYYINEANNRVRINGATQRVDLVFIWAKPIDASSTTTLSFPDNGDVPKKIYKAELGIVKGAGVGINFNIIPNASNDPKADTPRLQDEDGNALIIPAVGDEYNTSLGFSGLNIRGSFPSPDDLMNISPTLAEFAYNDNEAALADFNTTGLNGNEAILNSQSLYFVGQSILPIAYVVVKNNAQLNANQVQIITPSNLVDIRPFFRTTELAYNERAGLAAAVPQVSLANPVASENFVLNVARDIYSRLGERYLFKTWSSCCNWDYARGIYNYHY
jgi:hypothetical protein